jgi:hypothetical protein
MVCGVAGLGIASSPAGRIAQDIAGVEAMRRLFLDEVEGARRIVPRIRLAIRQ